MTASLRIAVAALLMACTPAAFAELTSTEAVDPLESFNRPVFAFNDAVDRYTLKPLAKAYEDNTSAALRRGVSNVFDNLAEPFSALNHLLQGQVADAGVTVLRFGVNSTVGLLGFFDVVGAAGLDRRQRDFGQTLAVWGLPSGPFVVVPLLGPTTLRDGTATALTLNVLQVSTIPDVPLRNTLLATGLLSERAEALPLERVIDDVAIDRYAFVRDAWLQFRQASIRGEDADGAGR